jgi:hypothetical protein
VYGNGTFVAVGGPNAASGSQAKAAYSTDGENWDVVSFPTGFGTGFNVYALAYGNYNNSDYFVAGDDNGYIAYSSDGGASWTIVSNVLPAGEAVNALTYDSATGRFIAVGGTNNRYVAHTLP